MSAEPAPAAPGADLISERTRRDLKEFVGRQYTTPLVVHAKDRPSELGQQGFLKFLLVHAAYPDSPLEDWIVFEQDIVTKSGRHRHQGGVAIFVLEGTGYTVVDGVRHDWAAGDLVVLPLKPEGVEHQHFNTTPDGNAKWLAFIHIPTRRELAGQEGKQSEVHEAWRKQLEDAGQEVELA